MALAAATIWEVESGGSDTDNGGAFDPSATAGMFTDGAATSATGNSPVFSSASYNFVAGDVGAWVFIGAGTNWTRGWYKIASVASNNATLDAAVGHAIQLPFTTTTTPGLAPSTVDGCATTASPTGATWSIDYSQSTTARYAYTDLASAGAGLTVSSAAKPFAKEQVGNAIVITGGTNFTAGRYVIASVAAGVATVLGPGNITTGVGANGTGGQGGALASPGIVGAHLVASNKLFIKTATYTVTSASTNIAAGCYTSTATTALIEGYDTYRGDLSPIGAAGTRPTVIASGISTFVLFTTGSFNAVRNLILDGAGLTSSRGVSAGSAGLYNLLGQNFTNAAFVGTATSAIRCVATGCSTVSPFAVTGAMVACVAHTNTITGFGGAAGSCFWCVSYGNTGASSDGFTGTASAGVQYVNCVAYGNGRDGFRSGSSGQEYVNCIAEGNTGIGFNITSSTAAAITLNCGAYNNTGGARVATATFQYIELGFITFTASPFTNAAGADFSLNTSAGGGASARAAGYPGVYPAGSMTGYVDVGAVQSMGRHLARGFRATSS